MTLEEAEAIVDKAQEARDDALAELELAYDVDDHESIMDRLADLMAVHKLFGAAIDVWRPLYEAEKAKAKEDESPAPIP